MKKILLIILLCLFGKAYAQTIGYFRYDTSKFYTTKVGGRGSIDVTGNVRFTGLLPKSAGTDSVVVRDANGNLGTTAKGSFGSAVTASNGLTAAGSNVKLGGTLTNTTTIDGLGAGFDLVIKDVENFDVRDAGGNNFLDIDIAQLFAEIGDQQAVSGNTNLTVDWGTHVIDLNAGDLYSKIKVADSILLMPETGRLIIDTLNNETSQNTLMGWTSTTGTNRGKVGYLTLGGGGSISSGVLSFAGTGANTALSNLASVAINTSLLPGTDNAIDLGSIAKRYRSLYSMGGVFSDTLRVAGETHLMGNVGVGTDVPGVALDVAGTGGLRVVDGGSTVFQANSGNAIFGTSTATMLNLSDAIFWIGDADGIINGTSIFGDITAQTVLYKATNGHQFTGNVGIGSAADATGNLLVNDLASSQISLVTASTTGVLGKSVGYNSLIPPVMNFRLTTASDTPVTNGDRIAQSTIYMTPYNGNHISLYNGSAWVDYTTAQISLALSGLTSGKNYDVFAYDNSGTIALELSAAWTNDNTRADALTRQDGVLVKSGTTTRRLIGTIRTTSTTTTEDSEGGTTTQVGGKRFVWNLYNQVMRTAKVIDKTDSWSYTTATWRQENGNAGNQVEYVTGDASSLVDAMYNAMVLVTNTAVNSGIGISSTTTPSGFSAGTYNSGTFAAFQAVKYVGTPGLGYFYVAPLEKGQGSGTSSWFGDNGTTDTQSGLSIIITN